jgi:myosin heavy subunit
MNYLTYLSEPAEGKPEPKEGEKVEKDIGDRILACNPILEGFGNSKTCRNDNSSRFSKYVKMYFGLYEDKLFGATVKNYLLEKSRVIMVAHGERGYHVFYFLLRGAPAKILEYCKLEDPKNKGKGYANTHWNFLKGGGEYKDKVEAERWDKHDYKGF